MEKEILTVLKYFSFFSYPPTKEETYVFLKKKASKRQFLSILEKMVIKGVIITNLESNISQSKIIPLNSKNILNTKYFIPDTNTLPRYTLPEYSKQLRIQEEKVKISKNKIKKIDRYIKLLSLFPQIKLVGFSGTVAMLNADRKDDVDLFIITGTNRLFTGRFITLVLAQLLGLRREWSMEKRESSEKVCLNLFFDEFGLKVPKYKETEYVGHEVLQMKPIINKDKVYERFLKENSWIYKIFPNSKKSLNSQFSILNSGQNSIGDFFEFWFKKLQQTIIKLHQTNEIVTDTQLWFHPEDWNKKLL